MAQGRRVRRPAGLASGALEGLAALSGASAAAPHSVQNLPPGGSSEPHAAQACGAAATAVPQWEQKRPVAGSPQEGQVWLVIASAPEGSGPVKRAI